MAAERSFGILLPVFSLDGGTLDGAERFVDFLAAAGAGIWQVLPLGPTHADGSPYLALSAHAGNPALLDPAWLDAQWHSVGQVQLRSEAFTTFAAGARCWLDDYTLFAALREREDRQPWFEWPAPLRQREPEALDVARDELRERIERLAWEQFTFFARWDTVREACARQGVRVFGDVPLYVSHDSVDVWRHPHLFQLKPDGSAASVAGVPPDYFSATGQRWGNPLYAWDEHAADGFAWWCERMAAQAKLFDIVRIDHFRGLESYWEVPGEAPTAETGQWRPAPGAALLERIRERVPALALVAEDLGTITPEVDALRRAFDLPGIRVLHFGFDGMHDNPHAPHNVEPHMVLYTGTHDNDTTEGWYASLAEDERVRVDAAIASDAPRSIGLTGVALANRAETALIPMQDVLALGSEHRTNTPGTVEDNWCWRLPREWPRAAVAARLRAMAARHGRLGPAKSAD